MSDLDTQRQTQALDTTISWVEAGEGSPVILLHGLLDTHRAWRRLAPRLAPRFRVLMPDLAGHGDSGRPDAPYTLSWHARVLVAWMDAIGVPRAHLCGHSYGAGLAQWMLLEQRDRVDRLALIAAGGLGREVALGMRLAAFPLLGPRIAPLAIRFVVPVALRLMADSYGHIEPAEIDHLVRCARAPGTAMAFQRSLEAVIDIRGQTLRTADRAAEVGDLPPTALFWGTEDPIIPYRHALDTVAHARGVALTGYEGCGHFPHLDRVDELARDLTDFFCDPTRPSAQLGA
ncbi:MAG: hydrolase [Myxococcales bacterium]